MEENKYGIHASIKYRGDIEDLQNFIKQTNGLKLTKEQGWSSICRTIS